MGQERLQGRSCQLHIPCIDAVVLFSTLIVQSEREGPERAVDERAVVDFKYIMDRAGVNSSPRAAEPLLLGVFQTTATTPLDKQDSTLNAGTGCIARRLLVSRAHSAW